VLKVICTYTFDNDCDIVTMLLPLQGDYVLHLTKNRVLPYPNA
jgi:hypothetical protein